MSDLLEIAKQIDAKHGNGYYKSINSPNVSVRVAWIMNHYINNILNKNIDDRNMLKNISESKCNMVFGCDGCGCVIADSKDIYISSISYRCEKCKIRVDLCKYCQIAKVKSSCCKYGKNVFNEPIVPFADELKADIEHCRLLLHVYKQDEKYYWDKYIQGRKVETVDLTDLINKALRKRKFAMIS